MVCVCVVVCFFSPLNYCFQKQPVVLDGGEELFEIGVILATHDFQQSWIRNGLSCMVDRVNFVSETVKINCKPNSNLLKEIKR